jgi:hypothetical protein
VSAGAARVDSREVLFQLGPADPAGSLEPTSCLTEA